MPCNQHYLIQGISSIIEPISLIAQLIISTNIKLSRGTICFVYYLSKLTYKSFISSSSVILSGSSDNLCDA
ncbi:hypothetical protein BpHYR1_051239 [Brachionus plicatilis]|uniref:Uncharacterized protein n=1 Tax=Brachionus plicatilis TaxID=10195 RepID=A0A3M7RDV1_BRAPC|nr:hypothetical protein BpHYR1_051239 [Brachionus plicatilis]